MQASSKKTENLHVKGSLICVRCQRPPFPHSPLGWLLLYARIISSMHQSMHQSAWRCNRGIVWFPGSMFGDRHVAQCCIFRLNSKYQARTKLCSTKGAQDRTHAGKVTHKPTSTDAVRILFRVSCPLQQEGCGYPKKPGQVLIVSCILGEAVVEDGGAISGSVVDY